MTDNLEKALPILSILRKHGTIERGVRAALDDAEPGEPLKALVADAGASFPGEGCSYSRVVELSYQARPNGAARFRVGSRIARLGRAIRNFLQRNPDRKRDAEDGETVAATRAALETLEPELAAYIARLPEIREVCVEARRSEGGN